MRESDLIGLFQRTVAALSAERLVREALAARPLAPPAGPLSASSSSRADGGRTVVLGLGKPAVAMARGVAAALGAAAPPLHGTVVARTPPAPPGAGAPPSITVALGAHPVPDAQSEIAGTSLLEEAARTGPDDVVIFLIGGGGSALAAVPAPGLSLGDKVEATRFLLRSGASIEEMNVVRKHLSAIKGGQLARRIHRGARARALVLCDVPSGDLASVASGPTLPDPSSFADALRIVDAFSVPLTRAARRHLERGAAGEIPDTPKPGDPALAHIEHELLAQPIDLARTAARLARDDGGGVKAEAEPQAFAEPVEALAARVVRRVDDAAAAGGHGGPTLLAFAGEPTVRVPPGAGQGGRMQHLALLLARALAGRRFRAVCAGSDGRDGETAHCGAMVDGATAARAAAAGIDLDAAILRFDSARVCRDLGLALPAFDSDTNLCDLVLVSLEN